MKDQLFNVILANINKNVLLKDMRNYSKVLEMNGYLILSGFFEIDTDPLIIMAQSLQLELKIKLTNNSWALLHFKKN